MRYLTIFPAAAMIVSAFNARAESPLVKAALAAVQDAHFDQVIDFGPANEGRDIPAGSARRIAQTPNVDLAVIQVDAAGRMVDCANVLLSRDYPAGIIVPLGANTGAASVRFRRWDIERWNGGKFEPGASQPQSVKGWTNNPPLTDSDDITPGRTDARFQFMAPYPASLFKLLIAFQVMRMVDSNLLTLDSPFTYSVPTAKPETRSIRAWLDPMITVSDNHCTHALVKMLHERGRIEPMNREFQNLGLGTLQVNRTRPSDGYGWQTDSIHMTAFDTARLLWIIEGPSGVLWKTPAGNPVTAGLLSNSSRLFLKKLLLEQGLNEALSTSNLAGVPNVRPGIPSLIASRWINPTNGIVVVGENNYGVDVRQSNALAEVTYAHKSGLTYNYASDAGIVSSLPGKPFRRYIIALFSNLGYRYTDEAFAGRKRGPYSEDVSPISYTQRIPALGKAIDDAVTKLSAKKP